MKGYLLDTDIVVFLFRNKKGIAKRLASIAPENVYISEVTVAENVIPFSEAISLYAKERYRLKSIGMGIEDFDLLIGGTSVTNNLTMVTNNVKHYSRIEGIKIENWAL